MDFKPLGLEHIGLLRPYFEDNSCRICDCTIGGTFIWRDFFRTEFAVEDGLLYLKVRYLTGETAFTPPRGRPQLDREAYERIVSHCQTAGYRPRLCAVSAKRLEEIRRIYPGAAAYTDRAWSDYLYSSADIRDLPGRKYSGQRNHINRFMREYPGWSFERVDSGNLAKTRDFFEAYSREHHKDYPAYDESNIKTLEVLDNFEEYGLVGGVLKVGDKIVGGALGEVVGDTLFVHIEKSLTEYSGSYPMLVNQFARMFAPPGVLWINREEDDGVEGLRISKMSYHPYALLEKYVVEIG